jgi:hypothetical protein
VLAAGAALVALAVLAGEAALNTTDALPGSPFHSWRIALEDSRLTRAGTPEGRASLDLGFAEARIQDLDRAARLHRPRPVLDGLLSEINLLAQSAMREGEASAAAHHAAMAGLAQLAQAEDAEGRRLAASGRDDGDDARAAVGDALRVQAQGHLRAAAAYAKQPPAT